MAPVTGRGTIHLAINPQPHALPSRSIASRGLSFSSESVTTEGGRPLASARTWRRRVSPDEAEMLAKLRALYEEYQQLNRRITVAAQKRRFSNDAAEAARAAREEQAWLKDITGEVAEWLNAPHSK